VATETAPAAGVASSVLIAILARGMRDRIERAVAPLGIRARHLPTLNHLREHGASAQQTLLDAVGIDPSNLVGLLNELEDAGLIVRRRDRSDRRRGVIELSRKGERALRGVDRALEAVDAEVLAALTPGERGQLRALLSRAASGASADCSTVNVTC
jgi:MarR family transcriptional regulator, lower aerobic nicotinate degradation pathway regulator